MDYLVCLRQLCDLWCLWCHCDRRQDNNLLGKFHLDGLLVAYEDGLKVRATLDAVCWHILGMSWHVLAYPGVCWHVLVGWLLGWLVDRSFTWLIRWSVGCKFGSAFPAAVFPWSNGSNLMSETGGLRSHETFLPNTAVFQSLVFWMPSNQWALRFLMVDNQAIDHL